MASQEHLALLGAADSDDSDTSSSSSSPPSSSASSEGNQNTSSVQEQTIDAERMPPPSFVASSSSGPAKKRIKVALEQARQTETPSSVQTFTSHSQQLDASSSAMPLSQAHSVTSTGTPSLPATEKSSLHTNNNEPPIRATPLPTSSSSSVIEVQVEVVAETVPGTSQQPIPTVFRKPKQRPLSNKRPVISHRRSLPLKKKVKLDLQRTMTEGTESSEDGTVKAMVVDSDEDAADDTVAAVLMRSAQKGPSTKRKPSAGGRSVRLPPMSSPGLLIPPATHPAARAAATVVNHQDDTAAPPPCTNSLGLTSPAQIFDHAMSLVGYTRQARSKRPHRGSSTQRVVDDMFDSNIKSTLHFPPLLPPHLLEQFRTRRATSGEGDADASNASSFEKTGRPSLVDELAQALRPTAHPSRTDSGPVEEASKATPAGHKRPTPTGPRTRRKLPSFQDMIPLSLTLPYPEQYIQKRLEYLDQVRQREKAIVEYQEQEEKLEVEHELSVRLGKAREDDPAPKPSIVVPDIPAPPSPPKLEELEGFNAELDKYDLSTHPLYVKKANEGFVAHLEKQCFHITQGRYFGLLSNSMADPNFCGPSAPGVGGLTMSGATGLATAHAGGGVASSALSAMQPTAGTTSTKGGLANGGGKSKQVKNGGSKGSGGATKSNNKRKESPVPKPALSFSSTGTVVTQTTDIEKDEATKPPVACGDVMPIVATRVATTSAPTVTQMKEHTTEKEKKPLLVDLS